MFILKYLYIYTRILHINSIILKKLYLLKLDFYIILVMYIFIYVYKTNKVQNIVRTDYTAYIVIVCNNRTDF